MLKKAGFVAMAVLAGGAMFGGTASAASLSGHGVELGQDESGQVGLLNANNIDALHNVTAGVGVCDDNINVLGVQVPVQHVADGVQVPLLSPGHNEAAGKDPQNCASGAIQDGGTSQDN